MEFHLIRFLKGVGVALIPVAVLFWTAGGKEWISEITYPLRDFLRRLFTEA